MTRQREIAFSNEGGNTSLGHCLTMVSDALIKNLIKEVSLLVNKVASLEAQVGELKSQLNDRMNTLSDDIKLSLSEFSKNSIRENDDDQNGITEAGGSWAQVAKSIQPKDMDGRINKDEIIENMMEAKMRIDIKDNVIIYGFDEETSAEEQVSGLFEALGIEKPSHGKIVDDYKVVRIGTPGSDKLRPIKLCLDGEMKRSLMRRKKRLNDLEEYKGKVWINHDQTPKERHAKYLAREAKRGGKREVKDGDDSEGALSLLRKGIKKLSVALPGGDNDSEEFSEEFDEVFGVKGHRGVRVSTTTF